MIGLETGLLQKTTMPEYMQWMFPVPNFGIKLDEDNGK
jgi:hypothetical protein